MSLRVTSDTIGISNDYRIVSGLGGDPRLHYTRVELFHILDELPFARHNNLVRDDLTPKILPGVKPIKASSAALKPIFHDPGLQAIYQNYGERVKPEVVRLVVKIERSLPISRQATYLVNGLGNGTTLGEAPILGFMRIFDGSSRTAGGGTGSALPLERILVASGKSTQAVAESRDRGFDVLEIGKYYLNSDLNAADTQTVRKSVLRWLRNRIRNHETKSLQKTYYFTHVVSRVHQIAYQRTYGFKPVDRDLSKNLSEEENILFVRADDLLEKLNRLLEN
jgi:hypothetical protein